MKNQGFIAAPILIAIVLGIVVVGGGAYFVIQKDKKATEINPNIETVYQCPDGKIQFGDSECSNVVAVATSTQIKTYTNSQYGFSVDYPSSMFINDTQPIPPYHGYDSFPFFPDTLGHTDVQISLFPNSEMRSANSIAIGATTVPSIVASCKSFNFKSIKETQKNLAGENFLYSKIVGEYKAGPEPITTRSKILKNGICYEIVENVYYTGKTELDTHESFLQREARLDSIVQSFRFIPIKPQVTLSQPPVDGQYLSTEPKLNWANLSTENTNFGSSYMYDGAYVYFGSNNPVAIQTADPDSFVVLNSYTEKNNYGLDKFHVYYAGKIIPGADPKTFVSIDHISYTKDKNNAYYKDSVIHNADAVTFEMVRGDFSKDRNSVYYSGQRVSGADPATFKVPNDFIIGRFATDKNNVYFLDYDNDGWIIRIVPNANPYTFSILGPGVGKDDKNVYIIGNIPPNTSRVSVVSGADPVTFKLLPVSDADPKTGITKYYAEDKNNMYTITFLFPVDIHSGTPISIQTQAKQ